MNTLSRNRYIQEPFVYLGGASVLADTDTRFRLTHQSLPHHPYLLTQPRRSPPAPGTLRVSVQAYLGGHVTSFITTVSPEYSGLLYFPSRREHRGPLCHSGHKEDPAPSGHLQLAHTLAGAIGLPASLSSKGIGVKENDNDNRITGRRNAN